MIWVFLRIKNRYGNGSTELLMVVDYCCRKKGKDIRQKGKGGKQNAVGIYSSFSNRSPGYTVSGSLCLVLQPWRTDEVIPDQEGEGYQERSC
jgi:hypothetical protein